MSIIRSTISLTQRWPPPFRSFAFSSARKKTQQPLVLSEYHKNSFKQRLSFNVFFIVAVVRQRCVGMYIIFCRCVGYVIIIERVGKLEVVIRRHLRFFDRFNHENLLQYIKRHTISNLALSLRNHGGPQQRARCRTYLTSKPSK